MAKPVRAYQACSYCRLRKHKCDEGQPCQFCRDNNVDCKYKGARPSRYARTFNGKNID